MVNNIACFTRENVTYTGEGDTTVTALGSCGELFQVMVNKLATGSLDYPSAVGGGIVWRAFAEGDTLGHCDATESTS